MNILIKQVPDSLTRKELQKLVGQALKRYWRFPFTGRNTSYDCRLIRYAAKGSGTIETHGLVRLKDRKSAMILLKKLNGISLNGQKLEACRYYQRSVLRDRRTPLGNSDIFLDNERRRHDRRRSKMVLNTAQTLKIEGLDRFRKTYG